MSALSSVATIPFISTASPSIAARSVNSDQAIVALAAEIIREDLNLASIEDRRALAERTMKRWKSRNPKPEIREFKVGTNAEYEIWFKRQAEAEDDELEALRALDPNADIKLAMNELESARRKWRIRLNAAENRCGWDRLSGLTVASKEKIEDLLVEFRSMRPTTFEGLAAKARVSRALFRHEERWSDDIAGTLNYEIGILAGDFEGDEDELLSEAS